MTRQTYSPEWTYEKKCKNCERVMLPTVFQGKKRKIYETKDVFDKRIYCSHSCKIKYLIKTKKIDLVECSKKIAGWNRGKRKKYWEVKQTGGYVRLIYPDGGFVYKHRYVINAPSGLVVHHRNGDRSDNRPDNLQLMSASEHTSLHHRMKKNGSKTK